jgi:hypothetical protein
LSQLCNAVVIWQRSVCIYTRVHMCVSTHVYMQSGTQENKRKWARNIYITAWIFAIPCLIVPTAILPFPGIKFKWTAALKNSSQALLLGEIQTNTGSVSCCPACCIASLEYPSLNMTCIHDQHEFHVYDPTFFRHLLALDFTQFFHIL